MPSYRVEIAVIKTYYVEIQAEDHDDARVQCDNMQATQVQADGKLIEVETQVVDVAFKADDEEDEDADG
jgi:hypothetical protein